MRYVLLILALMASLSLWPKSSGDTTKMTTTERADKFYDSLKAKSNRRGFSRLIMRSLLRNNNSNGIVIDQGAKYRDFEGDIIANITIDRHNVYDDPRNYLERMADNLHVVTRERKIKYDLLFKVGQRLDAQVLVKTQQLLMSRGYLYNVVIVLHRGEMAGTVDVDVVTRDRWTISADLRISGEKTYIGIFDANLLGTGNKLKVNTNFFASFKKFNYQGNIVEFDMSNIFGTFFSLESRVGKEFEYSDLMIKVDKKFILPNDYMLGASYDRPVKPRYIFGQDTLLRTTIEKIDFWGGISRRLPQSNWSIYMTSRHLRTRNLERPDVSAKFNPQFFNRNLTLVALGLYRERFLTTSLIYGYGNVEYISLGCKAELVGGYNEGEFGDSWYTGASWSSAHLFAGGNYIMGKVDYGTYIRTSGGLERSALNVHFGYFTRLLRGRSLRVRQLLFMDYTKGWNRMDGNGEILSFRGGMALPRSFRKDVRGTNRAVINTETVLFTPLEPLGFRLAFFAFADFGLIGYNANIFKNDFFNTLGIGVRIKNERVIFSTIQLTFGVCLGRGGMIPNQLFRFSNQQTVSKNRFAPVAPSLVPFY